MLCITDVRFELSQTPRSLSLSGHYSGSDGGKPSCSPTAHFKKFGIWKFGKSQEGFDPKKKKKLKVGRPN
jgi:hypothetical protein